MASTNICIAISSYYIDLNDEVFDILKSKIDQIEQSDKVLYISKKYVPRNQMDKLYAFLNSLDIQFFVKDTNYFEMLKSLRTKTNFIVLWSGKDDYIANLILTCRRYSKVVLDYTIVDQKQSSLWSQFGKYDAIGITTNGFYVNNKSSSNKSFSNSADEPMAICGRGCAFQFRIFEPSFPVILGQKLKHFGNNVHVIGKYEGNTTIFTFPVKPTNLIIEDPKKEVVSKQVDKFKKGDNVPGYACKSKLDIIEKSLEQLLTLMTEQGFKSVLLPRVGCGNGELNWFNVLRVFKKVIESREEFYDKISIASFSAPPKPLPELIDIYLNKKINSE